nr:AhpC/TSA family protein [uncultured Allomuricauda sp.]
MKNAITILLALIFIIRCDSKPDTYLINAKIRGEVENGTKVFLKTTDSLKKLQDLDTTTIENGVFSFTGTQEKPKLYYIFLEATRGNVPLFVENGTIDVNFQKDSMNYAQVKGTQQNALFMKFLEGSRRMAERARSMQRDMGEASRAQDTATVTALREEFLEFQEDVKTFNIDFAKENPDAIISALILGNLLFSKAVPNDEAQQIYDTFTPEIKASGPGKELKEQLDKLKNTDIGSVAPDFSAPTPNGDLLALRDVKGKVTLVDFWAAWCRPCRAENPNIVSVYKKYHDKGLNVVGVSLDSRAEDWKNAIAKDSLAWNHISNLKRFQDPIAQLYNINAIPAAFLLDENGVIIAKNLRGPALEEKVAELLN